MGMWHGTSSKVYRIKFTGNAGKSIKEIYHMDQFPIGQGAFAKVFKGHQLSDPNFKVAIKCIDKTYLKPDDLKVIDQEVLVLRELNHPNIVKYYDSIEDRFYLWIITEFWPGSTLGGYIKSSKRIGEKRAASIVYQILKAVQYCHSKDISHRDMKPDNIMIDENMNVKLIDFGLSKLTSSSKLKSVLGSPQYMSPEVSTGVYSNKCDIWPIGVMLYEMISGEVPFHGRWVTDIKAKIESKSLSFVNKIWSKISPEWIDLIQSMLKVNPDKRISAKKALKHKWFKKIPNDSAIYDTISSTKNIIELHEHPEGFSEVKKLRLKEMEKLVDENSELVKIKTICEILDPNCNGTVTVDEMKRVIDKTQHKITDKHMNKILNQWNYIIDGNINYIEFLAVTVNRKDLQLKMK